MKAAARRALRVHVGLKARRDTMLLDCGLSTRRAGYAKTSMPTRGQGLSPLLASIGQALGPEPVLGSRRLVRTALPVEALRPDRARLAQPHGRRQAAPRTKMPIRAWTTRCFAAAISRKANCSVAAATVIASALRTTRRRSVWARTQAGRIRSGPGRSARRRSSCGPRGISRRRRSRQAEADARTAPRRRIAYQSDRRCPPRRSSGHRAAIMSGDPEEEVVHVHATWSDDDAPGRRRHGDSA